MVCSKCDQGAVRGLVVVPCRTFFDEFFFTRFSCKVTIDGRLMIDSELFHRQYLVGSQLIERALQLGFKQVGAVMAMKLADDDHVCILPLVSQRGDAERFVRVRVDDAIVIEPVQLSMVGIRGRDTGAGGRKYGENAGQQVLHRDHSVPPGQARVLGRKLYRLAEIDLFL